jgi:hypothetical protein
MLVRWFIWLALVVASASDQNPTKEASWQNCDRKRSRLARAILNEEFYPAVDKMNFSLPDSCPFLRSNDVFLDNELVRIYLTSLSDDLNC